MIHLCYFRHLSLWYKAHFLRHTLCYCHLQNQMEAWHGFCENPVWLIWKKVSQGASKQPAKLRKCEFSASQFIHLCNRFAPQVLWVLQGLAPERKGCFWRISLRHVWKTCHSLKGERKASSSSRCIFHKFNENWSTWRNELGSLLTRCGIENKSKGRTKSWDQNDGTSALSPKPWACGKYWGEESRCHPFDSCRANRACKGQMVTAAWYERAPH